MRHRNTLGMVPAVVLLACGSSNPMHPPDLSMMAMADLAPPSETAVMNAQMGSGQSGTAVLTDNGNNTTTIKITTTGGTDTGMQPAHIHLGTCGSNGQVYYGLTSLSGGTSTTMVSSPLSGLTGSHFYINVHNSANVQLIQTCGNIQ